jgi:hypothetical protein
MGVAAGSVCRAFHPILPGPDSSFGIRVGPSFKAVGMMRTS